MDNFTLTTTDDQINGLTIKIIQVSGYVDSSTFPQLQDHLQQLIDDGQIRIIVDLQNLDYISSAGLGVIMGMLQEIRDADGDLKLCRLSEKIRHLFDILGFSRLILIYDTIDEAKQAFIDEQSVEGEFEHKPEQNDY